MKILFCLMFLLVLIVSTLVAGSRYEPTIYDCNTKGGECDESKLRWVCGSDNQTYLTKCHLKKAQCSGHQVRLKHRGPCKECLESRSYAKAYKSTSINKFVPRCRSDGSYAPIQCMKGAGCWCSDSQGKPIPNTTTINGKPNCSKRSKQSKTNIRRSPPRNEDLGQERRLCKRLDQRIFNNNLVQVFHSEYVRYNQGVKSGSDETVIDWKFLALDLNKDEQLDVMEYREFRRLVRKIVKPKKCARLFGRRFYCDTNRDELLSRQEWKNCLIMKGKRIPAFGGDDNLSSIKRYFNREYTDEESNKNARDQTRKESTQKPSLYDSAVTPYPPVYLLRPKTIVEAGPTLHESEIETGCIADRAAALDEQKSHLNGGQVGYLPECTPDGRYQRVQCYRSVGYCWCVHEDTGKNIPGTSVKDGRPDCSSNESRPIKGCPGPQKDEFIKELKEFLQAQISSSTNPGISATNWSNDDEKIATLSFVLLDNNKNKVWEKKEWKAFRELMTASSALTKCGKKIPRYCDINNDKQITLSEWLNCLQVTGLSQKENMTLPNPIRSSFNTTKLKGPNPLESYLKSD